MKYQDLPEERKEQIRDDNRDINFGHEWWDGVYDWAKDTGKEFGLDIEDIYFSGFASQGDGACFTGQLRFKECNESDLPEDVKPIYNTLHQSNSLIKIVNRDAELYVCITHRGNYSHEHCMSFSYDDYASEEVLDLIREKEDDIEEALRDYARWIYARLENENDYLTSDEAVDQALYDEEYDDEDE